MHYHTHHVLLCLVNGKTLACSFTAKKPFQSSSQMKEHTGFKFLSCSWYIWDKCGVVSVFQGIQHGMSGHSEMSSHLHLSWEQANRGVQRNKDNFRLSCWLSHPNGGSLRQHEILNVSPNLLLGPLLQMDQPTSFTDTVRFRRPKCMD